MDTRAVTPVTPDTDDDLPTLFRLGPEFIPRRPSTDEEVEVTSPTPDTSVVAGVTPTFRLLENSEFAIMKIKTFTPLFFYFHKMKARLDTFKDWPVSMKIRPETLASSGFFYTGYGDKTQCFYCGCTVKNWLESDDPWARHALADYDKLSFTIDWFRTKDGYAASNPLNCKYLLLQKGEDFIQKTKEGVAVVKEEEVVTVTATNSDTPTENSVKKEFCCMNSVCSMCYDKDKEICILPCAHVCACLECALTVNVCPICRIPIEALIRVFIS